MMIAKQSRKKPEADVVRLEIGKKGSFGMTDVAPEFSHEHWTSCYGISCLLPELGKMKERLPSKGTSFLAVMTSEENANCTSSGAQTQVLKS